MEAGGGGGLARYVVTIIDHGRRGAGLDRSRVRIQTV